MQLLLWVQYEDEDGDKVVLASDDDLAAAVDHARLAGWKARMLSSASSRLFLLDSADASGL